MAVPEYIIKALKYHGINAIIPYSQHNQLMVDNPVISKDLLEYIVKTSKPKGPTIMEDLEGLFGTLFKRLRPDDVLCKTDIIVPPLDHFYPIKPATRIELFFQAVQMFDIFIGEVIGRKGDITVVRLICFQNRDRKICDLNYKVFMKNNEKEYSVGTLLRVCLVETDIHLRRLYVTANNRHPRFPKTRSALLLGMVNEGDFPEHYIVMQQTSSDLYTFSKENMIARHYTGDNQAQMLPTFMEDIETDLPGEKYASYIFKEQQLIVSKLRCREGIVAYINKKFDLASGKFDEALKCNPDNPTALLYAGYILREKEQYHKAMEMFRKASEINSSDEQPKQCIISCLEGLITKETDKKQKVNLQTRLIRLNRKHHSGVDEICKILFKTLLNEQGDLTENIHVVEEDEEDPLRYVDDNSGIGKSDMEIEESGNNKIEVTSSPKNAIALLHQAVQDTTEPSTSTSGSKSMPITINEGDDNSWNSNSNRTFKSEIFANLLKSKPRDRKRSDEVQHSLSPSDTSTTGKEGSSRRRHRSHRRHSRRRHSQSQSPGRRSPTYRHRRSPSQASGRHSPNHRRRRSPSQSSGRRSPSQSSGRRSPNHRRRRHRSHKLPTSPPRSVRRPPPLDRSGSFEDGELSNSAYSSS